MIDSTQLVAQLINFVVLVALLYKLLYKPVRQFMDKRTAEIEQNIKSAEDNQAAAQALRLQLEEDLRQSKQKARQFLDEASQRAQVLQEEMMAEAKKESELIIRKAWEETQMEKEKAWEELKSQVGELSLLLASRLVEEELDEPQHLRLIEQTLSQLDALEQQGAARERENGELL